MKLWNWFADKLFNLHVALTPGEGNKPVLKPDNTFTQYEALVQLRRQVISVNLNEEKPHYIQGYPTSEVLDIATAEDCNAMVSRIEALQAEVKWLGEEVVRLKEGDNSC